MNLNRGRNLNLDYDKQVGNVMKILWGGATAASQYEGGFEGKKGLDTQDCRPYLPRTSNATEETRLLTKEKNRRS